MSGLPNEVDPLTRPWIHPWFSFDRSISLSRLNHPSPPSIFSLFESEPFLPCLPGLHKRRIRSHDGGAAVPSHVSEPDMDTCAAGAAAPRLVSSVDAQARVPDPTPHQAHPRIPTPRSQFTTNGYHSHKRKSKWAVSCVGTNSYAYHCDCKQVSTPFTCGML